MEQKARKTSLIPRDEIRTEEWALRGKDCLVADLHFVEGLNDRETIPYRFEESPGAEQGLQSRGNRNLLRRTLTGE